MEALSRFRAIRGGHRGSVTKLVRETGKLTKYSATKR